VACFEVIVAEDTCKEGGYAVVRQGRLIAVVGAFLMGWTVLLMVVGCAGVRSEAPEEQAHTEATREQAHADRCDGTRTIKQWGAVMSTNDLPGCPKGGLLSGTDENDTLYGGEGEDKVRGLGDSDTIFGGAGNDVIYGGPGNDSPLDGSEGDDVVYGGDGDELEMGGGEGKDVLYGGDGNEFLVGGRDKRQPDKLYCGEGRDQYVADENDYVDSSCEKKAKWVPGIP